MLKTIDGIRNVMFESTIPLKDLKNLDKGLLNNIYYWRKNKLLPFFPEKLHFGEIDIPQLIWIRILKLLQSFSYTVENSKKICDYFFKDAYDDELASITIKKEQLLLEKKRIDNTLSSEEEDILNILNMNLADKNLLYVLKFSINYLSNLVIRGIDSGEESGILIFLDGSVLEFVGGEYYSHVKEKKDPQAPHIYISVPYLLKEFIDNTELEKFIMPQLLNEQEKMLLKDIRNNNIKELLIKKSGKDIIRIETTMSGNIPNEQTEVIKHILGLNNYDQITLSTIDEKRMDYKRIRCSIKSNKI